MKTLRKFLVCLILIQSCFAGAAEQCSNLFKVARTYKADQAVLDQISYGFEVEYAPAENPKILGYYKVKKYSDAEWQAMTSEQRVDAFKKFVASYPKVIRTMMTSMGKLELARLENGPEFLPQKLSVESHGTAEISGEIFAKESAMSERIRSLYETLGRGYWQSHIVFPKSMAKDISGFVAFSTDQAYIQALSKSYEKYQRDSKSTPGSLLVHYALGPITQRDFMDLIAKNDAALHGGKIGKGGTSRLINGPALRDDVYPAGYAGTELRQFSTRQEAMIEGTSLVTKLVSEKQMSQFSSFKNVQMLSHKIYEQLDPEPRKKWSRFMHAASDAAKSLSANIAVGGADYELRFLLPLRDWRNNPVVTESGLSPIERALAQNKIARATLEYKNAVNAMIEENLSGTEALTALRIAISKWAHDSGLESLFQRYEDQIQ